jgi:hypothetical protein
MANKNKKIGIAGLLVNDPNLFLIWRDGLGSGPYFTDHEHHHDQYKRNSNQTW